MPQADPTILIEMTAELVAAYVTKNHVRASDLPALISTIHASLTSVGSEPGVTPGFAKLTPPISIKKSLTNEYIISMEDGRQYQALKRHLTKLGMTPEQYRTKWDLPEDYPMVAPGYSARRSAIAKNLGVGFVRRTY